MSYFNNRSLALAILGIKEGYSTSELKAAYLKKAKIFHPDTGGTHEEFLKLQQAYEHLSKETTKPTLSNEHQYNTPKDYASPVYDFKYQKIDKTASLKILGLKTLELFVFYLSNSTYLFKATLTQSILLTLWFNNLLNPIPTPITISWLLQLFILSLYLLLIIVLLLLLVTIFHRNIWYLSLKLEKVSSKRLNKIRNVSVFLFAAATLPGYLIYLTLLLSIKIVSLLIKLVK